MVVPDHVADLQILVIDRVILTHKSERRLVMKISSLAAYALMRLGQQRYRLASAMTPLLAPRDATLGRFQRARSAFRYQPGERIRVPLDKVANASMPRSIPVC